MISVGNSTMTITTLILLLATGIVAVTAVDDCPGTSRHTSITSCCGLDRNYFFTFGRNTNTKLPSGIYSLQNFCENDSVEADAYCDNCNGGGGWLVANDYNSGYLEKCTVGAVELW